MMSTNRSSRVTLAVMWTLSVAIRAWVCLGVLALASLVWSGCASPAGGPGAVRIESAPPLAEAFGGGLPDPVAHAAADGGGEPVAAVADASLEAGTTLAPQAVAEAPVAETSAPESPAASEPDLAAIEERWGIRVLALRSTAAGFMLDFRYRVTDPEKALPLFDRDVKPQLIDQASGVTAGVPRTGKVGPLRNSDEPIPDRVFFILFNNPGRFIRRGNKVTVAVGDFKIENLTVN